MGTRERLEKLEAAHIAAKGGRWRRAIVRLEGQTDEEAWRLSEHRHLPLDDESVILSEERLRRAYQKTWGDAHCKYNGFWSEHYANQHMAKVKAEQEAVRAMTEGGEVNGNP